MSEAAGVQSVTVTDADIARVAPPIRAAIQAAADRGESRMLVLTVVHYLLGEATGRWGIDLNQGAKVEEVMPAAVVAHQRTVMEEARKYEAAILGAMASQEPSE